MKRARVDDFEIFLEVRYNLPHHHYLWGGRMWGKDGVVILKADGREGKRK